MVCWQSKISVRYWPRDNNTAMTSWLHVGDKVISQMYDLCEGCQEQDIDVIVEFNLCVVVLHQMDEADRNTQLIVQLLSL